MRNEEHFQFQTEFKGLVEDFTPLTLNIEAAFAAYISYYEKEQTALNFVMKSSYTAKIVDEDHHRDEIVLGTKNSVNACLYHYDAAVVDAAQKVKIVFDSYGNISKKSYDQETAAIYKLIVELTTNYAEEIALMNLSGWLNELKLANESFEALIGERYTEASEKGEYRMSGVRKEVDTAYNAVIDRIEALILINGDDNYIDFVIQLNVRIEKYNTIIAQREGRAANA